MSVTVTDNFTPQTWGQSYPETWGSTGSTWKYGLHDYSLTAAMTLVVTEALQRTLSRFFDEVASVTDQLVKEATWERLLEESVSVQETYWDFIQFKVSVSESFTLTDDETNKAVKGVLVTLNVAESPKKIVEKLLPITIFVQDEFLDRVKFVRNVAETIDVDELAGKHTSVPFEETFEIVDFFYKMFTGNISETISLAELLNRSFSVKRLFEESVALDELLMKHTEIKKEDLLTVRDTILQACNAILNNIFARHGEIATLEDFNKLVNQSPGFTEFIDFKVGEYDYEEALVKIAVKSKMAGGQPTINNLTMHVDIPDTDAKGTVTIGQNELNAPKRVMFSESENSPFYYNPPEVNVLVIGGYAGTVLTPYITTITTTYFEVEIRNASGNRAAGTISWFAKGY